jgi:hypothetical protein
MPLEKKIEQQNINPEQIAPVEQSAETSLDSTKIEQIPQPQAQENTDNGQAVAQVVIPEDQPNVDTPMTSEVIHKKVDSILSADMEDVFLSLDAGTQRVFKIKGEETTKKITNLLLETKVRVGEITKLILEWLRIIPQVNKHYLEQEAKIKTDNILEINKPK